MNKKFGALVSGDVFVQDGVALQKLDNGRAYAPDGNFEIIINKNSIVDYVGLGIWPDDERLKGVMPAIE